MKKILFFVGLLFILAGGGYMAFKSIRGIRNNNPGNIRKTNDKWLGLAEKQNDPAFFVFASPEYGIRALMKLLTNYYRIYGLNTVEDIIWRWAPPNENDTDAYVRSVANQLGVQVDDPLVLDYHLIPLTKAIIKHENGIQPYSDSFLRYAEALL